MTPEAVAQQIVDHGRQYAWNVYVYQGALVVQHDEMVRLPYPARPDALVGTYRRRTGMRRSPTEAQRIAERIEADLKAWRAERAVKRHVGQRNGHIPTPLPWLAGLTTT